VVIAANRADLMGSSVSRNRTAAGAERPPEGQRKASDASGSSHDFGLAGTAGRCCWRTTGPRKGTCA